MSLTDAQLIKMAYPLDGSWGDVNWINEFPNADDPLTSKEKGISLIARLLMGEDQKPIGMANCAQVLHNRMRQWVYRGAAGLRVSKDPALKYSWRGIIYSGGFSSTAADKTQPRYPLGKDVDNNTPISDAWRRACEYAEILESTSNLNVARVIADATVTDQMSWRGYGAADRHQLFIDTMQGLPYREYHSYYDENNKLIERYQLVASEESIFFNDSETKYNYIHALANVDIPDDAVTVPKTGYLNNNTGIPQFNASALVAFLKTRVGCGYVLGTYGQICTQQLLQNRAVADPANGTAYYLGDCARWIGKLTTDCSGLVEWFLLKNSVTNCDTTAAGMFRNWCTEKSTDMSEMPPYPGVAVFKHTNGKVTHMGIYVGKDRVIEAKGALYGIVVTKLSSDPGWTGWGWFDWLYPDIEEDNIELLPLISDALTYGPLPGYPDIRSNASEVVSHSGSYSGPLYKKGDSGPKIEMIRRRFWATNSSFVVNNFFDDALEAKIVEFQTANGLTVDGKVGSQTWRKIFPVLQKKTGSQFGAKEMQTLLNYQNYSVGTPDGLFGTGTENVLKAYQTARDLDPDGVCGDKTWESLTLEEPFLTEVVIDQNGDYTAICKLGDSNNLVVQLQRRLATQYNLPVTGTYDAMTNACIIAYQNANGITPNGNCGAITWKKLFPILKMGRGSRDEVRPLQMLLVYQKHGVLVDGIFGSGSDAAVKAYQTMRGLTSDGIAGEQTWASLATSTPMSGNPLYFGTGGSGSSSGGGSSSAIYRLGDNNAAIRQIKRRMSADNLYSGTVDTIFDATLEYAIKSFQSSQGARIDGLVGPATWSLLFPIVKKQTGQQAGAKAVQTLLNMNGFGVGTPDGLFGSGSETKLIAFQMAKGLTPDGLCGAMTWQKLCEI